MSTLLGPSMDRLSPPHGLWARHPEPGGQVWQSDPRSQVPTAYLHRVNDKLCWLKGVAFMEALARGSTTRLASPISDWLITTGMGLPTTCLITSSRAPGVLLSP